ncbi:Uncharacterised protein [uncultured archaeon]|nr:Uncharacterised protein [uncultured archaeon]
MKINDLNIYTLSRKIVLPESIQSLEQIENKHGNTELEPKQLDKLPKQDRETLANSLTELPLEELKEIHKELPLWVYTQYYPLWRSSSISDVEKYAKKVSKLKEASQIAKNHWIWENSDYKNTLQLAKILKKYPELETKNQTYFKNTRNASHFQERYSNLKKILKKHLNDLNKKPIIEHNGFTYHIEDGIYESFSGFDLVLKKDEKEIMRLGILAEKNKIIIAKIQGKKGKRSDIYRFEAKNSGIHPANVLIGLALELAGKRHVEIPMTPTVFNRRESIGFLHTGLEKVFKLKPNYYKDYFIDRSKIKQTIQNAGEEFMKLHSQLLSKLKR